MSSVFYHEHGKRSVRIKVRITSLTQDVYSLAGQLRWSHNVTMIVLTALASEEKSQIWISLQEMEASAS